MENIIRKTVQEEVERQLSPSSSAKKRKCEARMKNLLAKIRKSDKSVIEKMKKVHIKGKRFCLYRNEEYVVPQTKGGGFRYIYLPLYATIEVLQAKAVNIFFPEGTNSFMEKLSECNIKFTDLADNFVPPKITLRSYLEEKGQYLSRTYFAVHSRCDIFDFINSGNNGEGDHSELNEPSNPRFKHTTFPLEPQSSSSTQRSDMLFAPSHSFASQNEYLTTTREPAGQSLIPSQGSQGLDEVVVSVDISCHETTTVPKSSAAGMAKSGNLISVTANPNIEQNRDTTFSKVSHSYQ